ncbi:MAG: LysM domain-containing protein [Methylovirgula sp.]
MIGACAGLLAGCADSDRLSNPFSDPFRGDVDRTPTASISEPTQSYAPSHPVESRPLTPPSGSYYSHSSAAYTAPAYQSQHVASRGWSGSDTQTSPVRQSVAGWTAEGGMPVVVAYGESAEIIARRYGIPTEALVRTNGYASAAQIRPGAHIVIPTYNAGLAASSGVRFSAAREEQRRAQAHLHEEHLHFVRGPGPGGYAPQPHRGSQRMGRMKSWCFAKSMKSWRISRSRICATTPRPIQSCLFIQGRPCLRHRHIRSIACLPATPGIRA